MLHRYFISGTSGVPCLTFVVRQKLASAAVPAQSESRSAVDGDVRVVDESGENHLYPASFFTPITYPAGRKSFKRAEQAGAP